jgi:hypothetical protein
LEKLTSLFEKRSTVGMGGFVAGFGELLEGFPLGGAEVFRYFYGDTNMEVAAASS